MNRCIYLATFSFRLYIIESTLHSSNTLQVISIFCRKKNISFHFSISYDKIVFLKMNTYMYGILQLYDY